MPVQDTVILVPFKEPTGSKTRLAHLLSPERRHALALALFDETLRVLIANGTAEVAVVTDSEVVAERARSAGALVVLDGDSRGETAAIEAATRWSAAQGYARQLVVPGDMAALDPSQLSELLACRPPDPGVVLAPAVGEDGTNAILTSPPDCLPYRFGRGSFPEYLARAATLGLHVRVLRLRSFLLDIDTPEDLREFLALSPDVPAIALLRSWGFS